MIVVLLSLFFLLPVIDANVYSCEEVKYRLINSTVPMVDTWSSGCLVVEEGYSNMDQLKKIYLQNTDRWGTTTTTSFYDIATLPYNSHCIGKYDSDAPWEIVTDAGFTLSCAQEFSVILGYAGFTENIVAPFTQMSNKTVNPPVTFAVPQTGMWCNTDKLYACEAWLYAGFGRGTAQETYLMRSWPCSKEGHPTIPKWIVSFDNVITIDFQQFPLTFYGQCSNDIESELLVAPGDRVAVTTSGRSDDLQNLQSGGHWAKIRIDNWEPVDVTVNMTIAFDSSNTGYVILQKSFGGPEIRYYASTTVQTEQFTTDYFEVRYVPKTIQPSEVWKSNDNIVVEIEIAKAPRPPPTTTMTTTTKLATTTTPLPVTPPTDSPYCNCGADSHGNPVGWSYNDVWLDLVVILDSSQAMGKAEFEDAGALIESFISDGVDDFLNTDVNAPFYTRVGVIAMSDKAEVLYNLNMTKADSVQGKATIKRGMAEIDIVDAFNAALDMLNEGLASRPERASTRQVVYYMTDSNARGNMAALEQFRNSRGVIIVNNFLQEDEVEKSSLRDVASPGYFFTNDDNRVALQAFCKANCFCKSGTTPYGGSDPAIVASEGCYNPQPSNAAFGKAQSTCLIDGGFVATVHDNRKGAFLRQELVYSKSDYFWIGYEKSDDGVWQWDDQSTDSYTNWDVNEPSQAAVSKCAYVDTTNPTLPWGAGNCQLGFPYVCQYAPCSVGYKNC